MYLIIIIFLVLFILVGYLFHSMRKRKVSLNIIKNANNKQKLILTGWLIVICIFGFYAFFEVGDLGEWFLVVGIFVILTGIPAFILYKLWRDKTK